MKKKLSFIIFAIGLLFFLSCKKAPSKLPYLGIHTVKNNDTVYYKLPQYAFTRQDSTLFGSNDLKGKPYVAYFFFTSCPSVCPRMTQSAKRIQTSLSKYNDKYNIVSFSIDPDRDSLSKLRSFAKKYNADLSNWHFLRGKEEKIDSIGLKGFYLGISKDKNEPGGYLHSEKMILVDKEGHLRGYYSGTDAGEVKNLIHDLKSLIVSEK
ncbi:MAG TPA: SCO family protein [Bacteroidetes bacterium]|nr:SCO family protein [Bacteroidota bacterium]